MQTAKFFALFLFLFGQISPTLFGLEVKSCYIADAAKHESNQKILNTILEQELKSVSEKSADSQAHYLSSRIRQIASALLKQGFSTQAYEVPALDQNSIVSFNLFPLWEGDKKTSEALPLTFFVYIWPSEELALKYNSSAPDNCYYASNIHSHPLSCALAVLQGTLLQKNYEAVIPYLIDRTVRLIDEEMFRVGEGTVDDLQKSFIHQLYSKGSGPKPCITLHAYGLGSAVKVRKCFRETSKQCSYQHILQKDGTVQVVSW